MTANNTMLIIGLVFPEPETTAAGVRMMQLISYFKDSGFKITFATTAVSSPHSVDLASHDVEVQLIELNSVSFDEMIRELNPGWVIYDRFVTEEQFGWRVREVCPDAVNVLDTEDLHFLREVRKELIHAQGNDSCQYSKNDKAKREIASIYRCDLSLIISEFEIKLLKDEFGISPALLFYLPLLIDKNLLPIKAGINNDFMGRNHFMTMGNLKHAPNRDAIMYLKKSIWPLIRKALPQVELHIYGAYADQVTLDLHQEAEGFIFKGWAPNKSLIYSSYRVCLAPLRFGAGLKGKLLDAMFYGTPSVTSPVGAEGIQNKREWNGFVCEDPHDFAEKSMILYQDPESWQQSVETGHKILRSRFNRDGFYQALSLRLNDLDKNLESHRAENFTGAMLRHHSLQSTKYLSKWIEAKNAKRS